MRNRASPGLIPDFEPAAEGVERIGNSAAGKRPGTKLIVAAAAI
jgi:hypothetical protein